jgi:hypothetical protein
MTTTRISLHPGLSTLVPDDEPLRSAAAELVADLRELDGLGVTWDSIPAPGTKGQWSDLVVALGGPSAIGGAVRVFHLWLNRDRRRSLALTRDNGDGKLLTIELSGETISDQTVRDAIQRMVDTAEPSAPPTPEPGEDGRA